MRKIRLGIVGAGLIWEKSHKDKLKELEHLYEITAFSVRSDGNYHKLRKQYPDSRIYRDFRELVRSVDIDAVVVLTPLHMNAAVAMAALQAGKHALVEKPLATSVEDVHRILNLERSTGKKVLVLEQFRYDDRLRILKEFLGQGRIGDVVSYEMVDHGKIDEDEHNAGGYGNTDWRIKPQFPLGTLFDRGVHTITRLTSLFSKVESVYAIGSRLRSGFGRYDHILMTFVHPNGIHGTFSFAGYLDGASNYFYIRGTRGTIRVEKTRLELSGEYNGVENLPDCDSSLAMWQKCGEWFSAPETPVYGSSEALDDIAALVAVDRSIERGSMVVVS